MMQNKYFSLKRVTLLASCLLSLGAVIGSWAARPAAAQSPIPQNDATVYALTNNNRLINFNAQTPGTIIRQNAITGLAAGESLLGMDFRPLNNQLIAVSNQSRIYLLNPQTGAATVVGNAPFTPMVSGNAFGVDFNPVPDRIRFVSDNEQNLRLHPATGAVAATDAALAFAQGDANAGVNPNVVGAAYTNNFNGTATTTLYCIDSNLDALVRQGSVGGAPISPNGGQLFTVGALGVNTTEEVGFDILAPSDIGLASLTMQGATSSALYSINLISGAATMIGAIGGGAIIRDIAVPATYVPSLNQVGMAAVNAASYAGEALAPEMITALFGNFVTTNNQSTGASALPLPTTLAGMKVSVNGRDAGLFFVSPRQINFSVPATVTDGLATLTVTNSDNSTRTGTILVRRVAPGMFTANASGTGTAAGTITSDGTTFLPLLANGSEIPVNPGTAQRPTALVLAATGVRNAMASNANDANAVAEAVTATIQGIPAEVLYAGRWPSFEGLDQINLIIPPQLAGAGKVNVRLVVNGVASNMTTFTIGGTAPVVTATETTLGQTISGNLSTNDQVTRAGDESGNTYFFDAYRFAAFAGNGIALDARSNIFDVAVVLYKRNADGSLQFIGADDNLGGLGDGDFANDNALLLSALPENGEYVAFVTSAASAPNATGAYTLRLLGNAIRPLSYGANINGMIAADDLQTSAGDAFDAYFFAGVKDDRVQVRFSSTQFDPFLILNHNDGALVNSDDNGGGAPDALLSETLPASGIYVVIATPYAPGRTGAYSLGLTRQTGTANEPLAAVTASPAVAPRRLRLNSPETIATAQHYATRQVVRQPE